MVVLLVAESMSLIFYKQILHCSLICQGKVCMAPCTRGANLPLKFMEPSYFAWSNADFAPQNHGGIVSETKTRTKTVKELYFLIRKNKYKLNGLSIWRSVNTLRGHTNMSGQQTL